MRSVVLGALLLGVVSNALNLYGVSPYWQPAVTGTVILLAVGFDAYQRKSAAPRSERKRTCLLVVHDEV